MAYKAEIAYYKSPIGILEVKGSQQGILSIYFVDKTDSNFTEIPDCLKSCIHQLDEYFLGSRKIFDVKLQLQGTDFQKKVWKELCNIPFGKTRSYLEQSNKLGNTKAIRAVANANGKNPISIIVPCHRVIGSNGSLTGYAGEIWRKKWLLEHESDFKQGTLF